MEDTKHFEFSLFKDITFLYPSGASLDKMQTLYFLLMIKPNQIDFININNLAFS